MDWLVSLYESGDNGLLIFVFVTIGLGCGAAFVSGRAIAQTWRPLWHVPLYMLLLAVAVRFIHYALFTEPFLSAPSYAIDFVVLLAAALLGFRSMRAQQMATQYGWLYHRRGWLGWMLKS